MKAVIVKKQEIAIDTLYVELKTVEDINFEAGQFFTLTLPNPPHIDLRGSRRMLGFVNSPSRKNTVAFVVRKGPSAFKRSLWEMKIDSEVEVGDVNGTMTLPENQDQQLIIVTGGIGIAPYLSMLSQNKEQKSNRKVKLIYANTTKKKAIFLNELKAFERLMPNFKLITVFTEGQGLREQVLKQNIHLENSQYFVSGTPRFVPTMVKTLKNLGVLPGQIKFEIFSGY